MAIPEPGLLSLSFNSKAYGSIFEDVSELKCVVRYQFHKKQRNAPLTWKIPDSLSSKSSNQSIYTKEKVFTVTSKKSVSLKL